MSARRTLLGAVAAGALPGCTLIGPDYAPPSAADISAPAFVEADSYADLDLASGAWWRAFDDPALDRLVGLGLAENRDLAAAFANVNAARSFASLARLERVPADELRTSYQRSRNASEAFAAGIGLGEPADPFPTNNISDLGLAVSWELDLFGRVTRSIEIAKADLGEAQALLADLSLVVAADIVDAYVNLRGLEAQLAVARQNAANQEETVALTVATRDAGRGTDLDVERARAQLAGTLATIPSLRASVAAATYELGLLTGQTPETIADIVAAPAPLPTIDGPIPVGDPAAMLRRRPDIAARERALASATEEIGLNMAAAFPRVDFVGNVGYTAPGFNNQFSDNALNFAFGPSISWSLTNLLRAREQVAAARAGADAAFAAWEGAVLAALAETETALAAQRELRLRLAALAEAERASGEAERLARLRYENGATDFLDVLDAERRKLEAANAHAEGQTDAARAQVAVFRALRMGPAPFRDPQTAEVETGADADEARAAS